MLKVMHSAISNLKDTCNFSANYLWLLVLGLTDYW